MCSIQDLHNVLPYMEGSDYRRVKAILKNKKRTPAEVATAARLTVAFATSTAANTSRARGSKETVMAHTQQQMQQALTVALENEDFVTGNDIFSLQSTIKYWDGLKECDRDWVVDVLIPFIAVPETA